LGNFSCNQKRRAASAASMIRASKYLQSNFVDFEFNDAGRSSYFSNFAFLFTKQSLPDRVMKLISCLL
jgi:hypothetical protein